MRTRQKTAGISGTPENTIPVMVSDETLALINAGKHPRGKLEKRDDGRIEFTPDAKPRRPEECSVIEVACGRIKVFERKVSFRMMIDDQEVYAREVAQEGCVRFRRTLSDWLLGAGPADFGPESVEPLSEEGVRA